MTFVEELDAEWDAEGFLGQLRVGKFLPESASRFLLLLQRIEIPDGAMVPKRALSLLWYLPSFLAWQRGRVIESGSNVTDFDHFVTEVHNTLENVLGVP